LFAGSLPCFEGFSPGTLQDIPTSVKINISKFQLDSVEE
jgi:hypothetical protein